MGQALKQTSLAATGGPQAGTAFLGVSRSAKGQEWRERLDARGRGLATAISQRSGLPEILGRILAGRNVAPDEVERYLDPSIKSLMPDPNTLRDMERAAERLALAIERQERIAIFGDYDVDGACSSALLARFLAHHGVPARIYIPDRLFEGYGPNVPAIEGLVADGARLIVTVDCGTTSFEPLAAARRLGADVLVIDHHQADDRLPDAVVVNPNRQDDLSGLGHLCAAGVVFMVLVAASRTLRARGFYNRIAAPDLLAQLDLVALATVADVVPLQGLNRAFVTRGLKVMHGRENLGLKALADVASLNAAPNTYHLGFILGPRINAGGRIGDAALGAKLLSIDDETEAARIAALLDRLNKERKVIEQQTVDEAMAAADAAVAQQPDLRVIMLGGKGWHKGIVGLVSSRVTERYCRPSCIIAWDADGANGTGSLRSVAGVDIGAAVRAAVAQGLLAKGGGHAMAAGLTVPQSRFSELKDFFNQQLAVSGTPTQSLATLEVDGALAASGATGELIGLLDRVGPYGQGNPAPRFVFPAHRVKFAKVVGDAHVRCLIESGDGSRLDAVAFRAAGQPVGDMLMAAGGLPLHLAGTLKRDTWGGREKIELQIEDVADPRTCAG